MMFSYTFGLPSLQFGEHNPDDKTQQNVISSIIGRGWKGWKGILGH